MALKSPLMPSPADALVSAFSPYNDSPASPASHSFLAQSHYKRISGNSDSLAPPSPYPQQIEPSPVDSNGTEGTEIEEDEQDNDEGEHSAGVRSAGSHARSPFGDSPSLANSMSESIHKLDTSVARPDSNDGPQSVIHAPADFKRFDSDVHQSSQSPASHSRPLSAQLASETVESPRDKKLAAISPVNTDVPKVIDRSTPRAQSRQDLEEEWKRKSRRTSSLEDIPEAQDKDVGTKEEESDPTDQVEDSTTSKVLEDDAPPVDEEIVALRTALAECWTLCNTLASLSSTNRMRTFKFSGRQEVQEHAWQTCWRLCQKLYESLDRSAAPLNTDTTLGMCRDFCQSLFEARQRSDEVSDSVLRVSFELNNHLFNTQDRTLPEAFKERTLDFYVTLCHRLMKQPTSLPAQTDALLRACWALAEMLFSLRQSQRDGKSADEDLLGSAVQSCWELCDLFREGWKQVRPERATPRPNQAPFSSTASFKGSSSRSEGRSGSSMSGRQYHDAMAPPPETPTTIFDDESSAASSPDDVNVPNILVLGPSKATSSNGTLRGTHHDRWTSNASVFSGYSDSASSQRTSSTARGGSDHVHQIRLRYLFIQAGIITGYTRNSGHNFKTFVAQLPNDAFGLLPWQMTVLDLYKKQVRHDSLLSNMNNFPSQRLDGSEIAKSIRFLGSSEQVAWVRDLYRIVFKHGIDDAARLGGSVVI